MTQEEMLDQIQSVLGEHEVESGPFLGGTGYFIGGRMIVGVVGGRLCYPKADQSRKTEENRFFFAGRPVPGWVSIDGAGLDPSTIATHVEDALQGINATRGGV